jgi:hypothetical protein
MRLSTVLLTLQSLMDNDPIAHEPGYTNLTTPTRKGYSDFVEHSCISYILERAERTLQPDAFIPFQEIFKARLPKILERLQIRLKKLLETQEKTLVNLPYQLHGTTRYASLLERVCLKLKAINI